MLDTGYPDSASACRLAENPPLVPRPPALCK
jgi:hypothetical protein